MKILRWLCRVTGYEAKIRKHERQVIGYDLIHTAGWLSAHPEAHNVLCIFHKHLNRTEYPGLINSHAVRDELIDYKQAGRIYMSEYSQTINEI